MEVCLVFVLIIPVLCVEDIKAGLCHVRSKLGLSCTRLLIHAYLSVITRNLWLHKINHCLSGRGPVWCLISVFS